MGPPMPSSAAPPPLELTAARDVADFVANPVDRYVARRSFCFWQVGAHTKGVVAWGAPDVADAREMVAAFEAGTRLHEPHVSLVDMRSLRAVDTAAFAVVMSYMTQRQELFEKTVRRQALLHAVDAIGAAVAGFYAVVPARYPVATFVDLVRALAWLAPEDPVRTTHVVQSLRASYVEAPEIVARLRCSWAAATAPSTLSRTARLLGMSPRSLQRRLEGAGTSFRDEVTRERLARAERLLAESDLSIKAIAAAVDLSAGRLTALFRRAHDIGPSEWRRRASARGGVPFSRAGTGSRSTRLRTRGR